MKTRPSYATAAESLLMFILLASALLKLMSCITPSQLMSRPHPVFRVQYKHVVALVATAELATVVTRAVGGRRLFSGAASLLGINFLLYHAVAKILAVSTPCRCLGDLVDIVPAIGRHEGLIGVVLASAMVVLSVFLMLGENQDTEAA